MRRAGRPAKHRLCSRAWSRRTCSGRDSEAGNRPEGRHRSCMRDPGAKRERRGEVRQCSAAAAGLRRAALLHAGPAGALALGDILAAGHHTHWARAGAAATSTRASAASSSQERAMVSRARNECWSVIRVENSGEATRREENASILWCHFSDFTSARRPPRAQPNDSNTAQPLDRQLS